MGTAKALEEQESPKQTEGHAKLASHGPQLDLVSTKEFNMQRSTTQGNGHGHEVTVYLHHKDMYGDEISLLDLDAIAAAAGQILSALYERAEMYRGTMGRLGEDGSMVDAQPVTAVTAVIHRPLHEGDFAVLKSLAMTAREFLNLESVLVEIDGETFEM